MVRTLSLSYPHKSSPLILTSDQQGVPALFRWLSKCVQLSPPPSSLELSSIKLTSLPSPSSSTLSFLFFVRQYPKIVQRVEEEDPVQIPSDEDPEVMVNIPVDITGKNPNGTEFDNLYLDVS